MRRRPSISWKTARSEVDMSFGRESDMYPEVMRWLREFLKERHRGAVVRVFDGSRKSLSRVLSDSGLHSRMPPEWVSWEIHVDVVGVAVNSRRAHLAFVECKLTRVSLRDLSQALGYSRIALPRHSFLVSPKGPADSLRSLLVTYNRVDVLRYHEPAGRLPRAITVATWRVPSGGIDWGSALHADGHEGGRI